MVVVSGTFLLSSGSRNAVLAAMAKVVADTVKEPGCLSYRFYCDPEDENSYRVFEEWQSPAHLDAHLKTPHLLAYREALSQAGLISRDVRKYHVATFEQL